MTRIVIYVQNEEIEALRPLQARLLKQGALVTFSALKYQEVVKADRVLTTPRHLENVKKLFAGTNIPVQLIEDDASPSPAPAPVEEPQEGITLIVPEPDEVVVAEPAPELPAPASEGDEVEVIEMTVSEQPTPTPSRRTRKQ